MGCSHRRECEGWGAATGMGVKGGVQPQACVCEGWGAVSCTQHLKFLTMLWATVMSTTWAANTPVPSRYTAPPACRVEGEVTSAQPPRPRLQEVIDKPTTTTTTTTTITTTQHTQHPTHSTTATAHTTPRLPLTSCIPKSAGEQEYPIQATGPARTKLQQRVGDSGAEVPLVDVTLNTTGGWTHSDAASPQVKQVRPVLRTNAPHTCNKMNRSQTINQTATPFASSHVFTAVQHSTPWSVYPPRSRPSTPS